MPKLISLIKKKTHLSDEDFKSYYETYHAPLIQKLFPMLSDYKRTFLPSSQMLFGELTLQSVTDESTYDVITELWFNNDADLEAFITHASKAEILKAIRDDEANFLLSESTVTYEVAES